MGMKRARRRGWCLALHMTWHACLSCPAPASAQPRQLPVSSTPGPSLNPLSLLTVQVKGGNTLNNPKVLGPTPEQAAAMAQATAEKAAQAKEAKLQA